MKKIIKSVLVPLIISTICGYISAKAVYKIYEDSITTRLSSSKIYLLENGEYDNYEDMRENNTSSNFIYYKDNNKYKSIVALTRQEENIKKIKDIYNNITVEEYYISNNDNVEKQKEYDKILSNTFDEVEIKKIVNNILELYKENDKVNLILNK